MENKFENIAKNIVDYSFKLTRGNTLLVDIRGESQEVLATPVIRYAQSKGINVLTHFVKTKDYDEFWETATIESVQELINGESYIMKKSDAILLIREESHVILTPEKQQLFKKYFEEVHQNIRLKKQWCLTEVPTLEFCEKNHLNLQDSMATFISSCSIDYNKLNIAMDSLSARMKTANIVRIKGNNTDISFSIKGMPRIKCIGNNNLPDGELFTAPIKNTVNGIISYNTPSLRNGITFENVTLKFKDGKIISASAKNNNKELEDIFNIDEGARFVGEFSFGLNPLINNPQNSILYDEKISGSIHFTPGSCYDDCDNSNRSALHWDLVLIQTKAYGGGEIWFDDELIRKDGLFVPSYLENLNPVKLLS